MKRKTIIGIDAGGTHTRAILYENESVVDTIISGSGNLKLLGIDKAVAHFSELIKILRIKHSNVAQQIVLGLAGAGNPNDRKILSEKLTDETQIPCRVETDARIALYGAFDGGSGMILISGTGSISYGITKGMDYPLRVGGWGWQLGDEGSGQWLGREALRCVLLDYDGRGESTLLKEPILEHLSIQNPEQILQIVYTKDWTPAHYADIAPIVLSLSSEDLTARKLVHLAATHLARHLIVLQNQLGGKELVNEVVFVGGLIENDTPLKNELEIELNHVGTFSVVKARFAPEIGAARMGLTC